MILAVDTSGRTASCAVAENGVLLGYRMLYTQRAHSQILLPMVKDLLAETGHTVQDVDLFAAANGPATPRKVPGWRTKTGVKAVLVRRADGYYLDPAPGLVLILK